MSEKKNTERKGAQEVVVTDIRMPFSSIAGFMVQWAIASIPAFIILAIIQGLGEFLWGSFLVVLGAS